MSWGGHKPKKEYLNFINDHCLSYTEPPTPLEINSAS